MKETATHIYFWGSIYSQWYKSNFTEGLHTFNTAEKYMMYHKAMLFKDEDMAKQILKSNDPKVQKALGKKVKNFSQQIWDEHKLDIVIKGNLLKFSQDVGLKNHLLATGDKILVEGSPYDTIWGVGLKYDNPLILDETNWKGENLLGKALMEVRKQLK